MNSILKNNFIQIFKQFIRDVNILQTLKMKQNNKGSNQGGYQGYNVNNSNISGQKKQKSSNINDPYKSASRSLVARDRNNGTGDSNMNKAGQNALELNIHRGNQGGST